MKNRDMDKMFSDGTINQWEILSFAKFSFNIFDLFKHSCNIFANYSNLEYKFIGEYFGQVCKNKQSKTPNPNFWGFCSKFVVFVPKNINNALNIFLCIQSCRFTTCGRRATIGNLCLKSLILIIVAFKRRLRCSNWQHVINTSGM